MYILYAANNRSSQLSQLYRPMISTIIFRITKYNCDEDNDGDDDDDEGTQ